jgi:hypothetical protein
MRPATRVLSGQQTVRSLCRSMLHPMAPESPFSTFRSLGGSPRKVVAVAVENGINQVETHQAREIHPPLPSRWTSMGKNTPGKAQEAEVRTDFPMDKYETRTERSGRQATIPIDPTTRATTRQEDAFRRERRPSDPLGSILLFWRLPPRLRLWVCHWIEF